ncbi:hypothetical protein F183_A17670 [Bryobacterales bacterium F-183]|nr:hypothetical protein F183_A17670 [Bryobacterales bacterium F-183]
MSGDGALFLHGNGKRAARELFEACGFNGEIVTAGWQRGYDKASGPIGNGLRRRASVLICDYDGRASNGGTGRVYNAPVYAPSKRLPPKSRC